MQTVLRKCLEVVLAATLAAAASGCGIAPEDHADRLSRGMVYYLDGAGAAGVTTWVAGVRQGLVNGGYDGAAERFNWQTGLGLLADQIASNEYKRQRAADLAGQILEYRKTFPDAPVTIIAKSAGTAIAVFALEALPDDAAIDNVIFLSGSLSATYDLTPALSRVRGRLYITTSPRDYVLSGLVPLVGTSDREADTDATIGAEGPQVPPNATNETAAAYDDKIVLIPWTPDFAPYINFGNHYDTVSAAFVAHVIAPLIETAPPDPNPDR